MAEQALANVVRLDLITDETTPRLFSADTSDEVGVDAIMSEGPREMLRSKNRILGQNIYEDLILGYKLSIKDLAFEPEKFAVIDGGTYTAVSSPAGYNYAGPAVGTALTRVPCTTDVWTEEKDADGETKGYIRWRFPRAKGKPVKFTYKDGKFFAPEYEMESRSKVAEKPILVDWFDALPTGTASELLAAVNV